MADLDASLARNSDSLKALENHNTAMGYEIDRTEPSPQFMKARYVAGCTLQEQFMKLGGKVKGPKGFRWVKAELTWPSFDHFTFCYGNRVFSVLVDAVVKGRTGISQQAMDRFLDATRGNNLIPCIFPVRTEKMHPVSPGWNLFDAVELTPVDPEAFDMSKQIVMSEWELQNFVIQIVRNSIIKDGASEILSFTDLLGVDPQIWFQDGQGNRAWVIVRHCGQVTGSEWEEHVGLEKLNPQLRTYDGFFAAVALASSAPILLDLEGNIIPLSQRFTGTAPLYRGDGFHIKFGGLKRIYVS
jgi:hypothetical protein